MFSFSQINTPAIAGFVTGALNDRNATLKFKASFGNFLFDCITGGENVGSTGKAGGVSPFSCSSSSFIHSPCFNAVAACDVKPLGDETVGVADTSDVAHSPVTSLWACKLGICG